MRTRAGLLWLVVLAGCGKNEDPAHPVSWYEQHGVDRDAKVAWCADDAQRQRTPDCMNATTPRPEEATATVGVPKARPSLGNVTGAPMGTPCRSTIMM